MALPTFGNNLFPEYSLTTILRPKPRRPDGRPVFRPVGTNILPGQPFAPAVMPIGMPSPVPMPVFGMPARQMYGPNPALNPIGLSFPMMPQPMLQPAASLRDSELMLRRPGQ